MRHYWKMDQSNKCTVVIDVLFYNFYPLCKSTTCINWPCMTGCSMCHVDQVCSSISQVCTMLLIGLWLSHDGIIFLFYIVQQSTNTILTQMQDDSNLKQQPK